MSAPSRTVTIHNPVGGAHWLVQIDSATTTTTGESVSFVVAVKRDPAATLPELQRRAVRQAIALLQVYLDHEAA